MQIEELTIEGPSLEELSNEQEAQRAERALDGVKKLNLEELADILEAATIIGTVNHAGIITHIIDHPTIGTAAVVQSVGDGALLIRGLLV